MDNFSSECISLVSFDKIYDQNIRPRLEEIDIFLKCTVPPYNVDELSTLLCVKPSEILKSMLELEISSINRLNFFNLVFTLSSPICRLIKRQWRYSNCTYYTAEMIADIYEINIHKITKALEELDTDYIKDTELNEVFKRIHTTLLFN